MTTATALERGRACFTRRAWGTACHDLSAADRDSALEPADLERLATTAFLLGAAGITTAAIKKYEIYNKFSYISTAGGFFLEYLEEKTLPAVEILEQRAK